MRRVAWILLGLLALLAIGAVAATLLLPKPARFEALPGRPLLGSDGPFHDDQTGISFEPPPGWAVQVRSTDSGTHRADRTLVKYKQYRFELSPAWLRVKLIDWPAERSLTDYLRERKAPENGFVKAGDPTERVVAGRPAAQVSYDGSMDTDGRGAKPHCCTVVVIRRGGGVLEFALTHAADRNADVLEAVLTSLRIQGQ